MSVSAVAELKRLAPLLHAEGSRHGHGESSVGRKLRIVGQRVIPRNEIRLCGPCVRTPSPPSSKSVMLMMAIGVTIDDLDQVGQHARRKRGVQDQIGRSPGDNPKPAPPSRLHRA